VTDVFGRINSYGHRLSDQERRQAGLVSDLARFVRIFSSEVRGDVSVDRLPLHKMPEISIDLSTTRYGYRVQAGDVFWVRQGVLRSTELRDSLDEQVVAVGVADTEADARKIVDLDGVKPIVTGSRWVVGVDREAKLQGISIEKYYQNWRDAIDNADLSQHLKSDVLSNLDMCLFKGLHILIISVPPQKQVSLFDGAAYARDGDQTVQASAAMLLAIAQRF